MENRKKINKVKDAPTAEMDVLVTAEESEPLVKDKEEREETSLRS